MGRTPRQTDAIADLVLTHDHGAPQRLGDLWRDRPVALVWLRHWG